MITTSMVVVDFLSLFHCIVKVLVLDRISTSPLSKSDIHIAMQFFCIIYAFVVFLWLQ